MTSSGRSTSRLSEGIGQVGVVLVTYRSAEYIGRAIESCRSMASAIVVVDNASNDQTVSIARQFQQVTVLANPENRGFAAAANQGIDALNTEFILLLNPDAALTTPVEPLVTACRQPGIAAATGALIDQATDALQHGFGIRSLPSLLTLLFETLGINRLFPNNAVNRYYRCKSLDFSHPTLVEQPAGALLLFRRSVWTYLGGFDERFYPVWFEDVDFCRRLKNNGWQIMYRPEVQAIHEGGHSFTAMQRAQRMTIWYRSMLIYARKHFSLPSYCLLNVVTRFIFISRSLVFALRHLLNKVPLGHSLKTKHV